jgi:DNA-binding SARP family transcriptional activator/transcriptional regulator with XRE-family HTH domain/tetratricopeptide (TPR) repeat protein
MNQHNGRNEASQFGSLVRAYRRQAGLTQRELAAKAGLSVAALRDMEQSRRCRPRANSLAALASAFGLDPDQAVGLARAAVSPRRRPGVLSSPCCPEDDGSGWLARSSEARAGLRLGVLGPVEAWRDGAPLYLGPAARRAVLGLLVMDPGVLVRRDTFIDVLWGDAPPRTAVELVQAHVSRIRQHLKSDDGLGGGGGAIELVGGGYRFCFSGAEVDVLVFRDLAARAAAARAGGDDVAAVESYERAVGLWRGEPLADVDVLCSHPGVTALRQELTGVLLGYAESACALGQHDRVLARLQAVADAEPLNEPVHARLMIALAGSGQQAAAVDVYEGVRSRLDRELGLYPGDDLGEAYVRVLRQDIGVQDRRGVRSHPLGAAAGGHVVPRQLPAAPRCFAGRAGELDALSALMEGDLAPGSEVVIAALTGMPGIGKTALAVRWAHQVADRFDDGQLFVNLRGSSRSGAPVTPTEAVRGFLTALGIPPAWVPLDTDGQAALYRSLLAGRRMLIVLDDVLDAEQVRPLLPGVAGCLVLATSRNRLTGLAAAEGAHLMTLDVLTAGESRDLLAWNLGAGRAVAELGAVGELIALCGRLPLALCDVAARAVACPGLPLASLVAEMRDARRRLDALETGDSATSVRMVFSWSRAKLGQRAARMFRLLGVHPGPDIAGSAAASLAALPRGQAFLALAELCDEHLLTEWAPGRYTCHDLLRSYAQEEARIRESEAGRRVAMRRVLDYYLHAACTASRFLCPGPSEVTWPAPLPGVMLEDITGPQQAAQWFENEQHVLLNLISHAAEGGYAPYAWELPWIAGWYYQGKPCWQRLVAAQESALVIAARLGDLAGLAMASSNLGWLRFLLGDIDSANAHLNEATELARQLGDGRLHALAGLSRAYVLQAQGRTVEAALQARRALPPYGAASDRP